MATFDLYKKKPYWWWYCYLALAACKGTREYEEMVEMVFDAITYYDNYGDLFERDRVKAKYDIKR